VNCRCTELWSRSTTDALRVHEDAWDVVPYLHDGSTCAYDFDALLYYLGMGSLHEFYEANVTPVLAVVERLQMCEDHYHTFTYQTGAQRLFVGAG
jgi:ADP-glucose pyrophosphorylase